jgi:hypothetical protein
MKKLLLFLGGFSIAAVVSAQCTPNITQSPAVIPCNGSGTLTANVPTLAIDQPQNNACMANFSQSDLAQSFIANGTNICGAGIYLTSGSGPANVTITLYNLLPNAGGVVMASGTVSVPGPGVWADVTWASTALTVGNTYYLVFTSSVGGLCIAGSTSNPYSGGMVYANPGYGPFPSYDYTFHTFSCGGPTTYAWSTGGTTQSIPVNTGGVYSVTVTVGPCVASASFTVVLAGPSSTISSANVACNGGSNGSAAVVASGGQGPYTYSWSPSGGTGSGASGLTANSYTCTITDNNGCTTTSTANITEPTAIVPSASSTSIACAGGSSSVTVTASGGTPAYTGTGNFTVMTGSYTYVVTDANGCTASTSLTITEPPAINSSVTVVNVSCNGGNNGSIDLTVSGGIGPYTFDWNSGMYTTEDISGLTVGSYTGTLTDANGCTSGGVISITEPPVLMASGSSVSDPTTCGGSDGAIDMSVSGGTPGYNYLWSNSATTEDITGLTQGSYNCSVTDANGCTATYSATLVDPALPVVTFTSAIDTLCNTDGPMALTGESPTGGTFSGTAVSGGMFDASVAGVGTHVITYTYTDASSCTASTTDSIYVDICLDVISNTSAPNVSVYPNPNDGTFNVQIGSGDAVNLSVYDMQGKLVFAQQVKAGTIATANIREAGVYMVEAVTADGLRTTQRVVVTN